MDSFGISYLELNQRASKFEAHATKLTESEQRKAEKQRLVLERAQARKQAHIEAVAELRRRWAEEAEKVGLLTQMS
jgi:phage-related minor tail protein